MIGCNSIIDQEAVLAAKTLERLEQAFGHMAFRAGQEEAIDHILAGRDVLVVMPTGAGKSMIYQLAGMELEGVTIVISPLIALMKDQVDSLVRRGVRATFINSALDPDERAERMAAMQQGEYQLVYVAPERLQNSAFRKAVSRTAIGLLAVDEAHCVSQWGHDFRPDYLKIAEFRDAAGIRRTAALTATATPQVQDDIASNLRLENMARVITGFNRPNLFFSVRYATSERARLEAVRDELADARGGAIIYAATRANAELVDSFLNGEARIRSRHYHAGLPADERSQIQDDFIGGRLDTVVATNAFGMGIDRADVRRVIHFNLPSTLEAYYQEAGRAGRDGEPARAVLLYDPDDRGLQEWFINEDEADYGELTALFKTLKRLTATGGTAPGTAWLTLDEIATTAGQHPRKARVGLSQLEGAGIIGRQGDSGFQAQVTVESWRPQAVKEAAAAAARRQRQKRARLARMVAYAETSECRRRVILRHFGDRGEPEAENCCDNCHDGGTATDAGKPRDITELTEAERAALAVLDAVARLERDVGKNKLCRLLKGSRAREMQRYGYDRHIYYGRLRSWPMAAIEAQVAQLLAGGYLKQVGGRMPVVRLTPRGRSAIRQKAPVVCSNTP